MLKKSSCLCLIIIIINAGFNPALTWADVNKNLKNNMQNRQDTSTSGSRLFNDATNAWQPYIANHKWLPKPPTFTPTMSKSTATTATTVTSTPLMQSSNYKQHFYTHDNHHTHHYTTHYGNQEEQQQQVFEYNGNYQKNRVNMPKLLSSQIPSTEINSLTTSIDALKAGTKASDNSNIENSFNSHESWLLYNPLNMVKTVHSQVQIPKDIISEAYDFQRIQSRPSILSQLHLPQKTDIEEKNYQPSHHYHQHASTIWPNAMPSQSKYPTNVKDVQQEQHISFDSFNTHSNVNASGKTDMMKKKKNLNDNNILTKASQQNFKTNEISNHNDDADIDEQFSKKHNVLKTVTTSSHHDGDGNGKYLNLKLTLLKKFFNNNSTLDGNSKDIHMTPYDKRKRESDRSNLRHENDDDTSYSYSNEDKIDEVNEPKIINSTPHHLVVVKSSSNTTAATTAVAAVTPAMKKYDTFSGKEIKQPVGEVQGRTTQIAADVMEQTFVSATPQVVDKTKCTTYSNTMPTAINTKAQRRTWSVFTTPQTTLSSASMDTSTSKSLSSEIVSGRKVKKVKKKLKKFLLPLLLAYKLKFITLLPLLVSGLVLLVGTTGMAGFFFALFMAIMSLKSSSRNAVVVKKY